MLPHRSRLATLFADRLATSVVTLVATLLYGVFGASVAQAGDWELWDFEDEGGAYAWRYLPNQRLQPTPVVVFLHGSGSGPEGWQPILAPVAETLKVALVVPKSADFLTFQAGADDVTLAKALARLRDEIEVDEQRIGLAGHSAGGGHAAVLAISRRAGFNAAFILGAPYRTVLDLADPDYTPPIRMYYGTADPNYQASRLALIEQWQDLGVPYEVDVATGYGHSTWPAGTLENGFRFLLDHPYATAGGCLPSATRLCLRQGRFEVTATWTDFQAHTGSARVGAARTAESGILTFFSDDNWEIQVKVLDGCVLNQNYWVFAAGTTNVGFTLSVHDRQSDAHVEYQNPVGQATAPILDVEAFDCP